MNAISQGEGCYWKSDDAAGLSFNEVDRSIIGGVRSDQPPTTVTCFNLHDTLNRGETIAVALESLTLIGTGQFSAERIQRVRYTGQSHRFGVYDSPSGIVILVSHGGGMRGYHLSCLWSREWWQWFCRTTNPDAVWSLCRELIDAYESGRDAGRAKITLAFLNGKLKRKRRKGRYILEVLP